MKEAILELRSAIRRLRPNLLLSRDHDNRRPSSAQQEHQSDQSTTPPGTDTGASEKYARPSQSAKMIDCDRLGIVERKESSITNELQLEAASELVDAIASFVWNLDCVWDSYLEGKGRETPLHDGRPTNGGKHLSQDSNDNTNTNNGRALHKIAQEPPTKWNEEAKSLIREGYGLIATSAQSSSLLFDEQEKDDDESYWQIDNSRLNYQLQQQQQEATRAVARTSILDLLPSLSTSACRNFLLVFLPHFLPLALLYDEGECGSVPLWLKKNGGYEDKVSFSSSLDRMNLRTRCQSHKSQSTELVDNAIVQIVEAFESLIHTDTLVPFLATISILFENLPCDMDDPELLCSDNARKPLRNDLGDDVSLAAIDDPRSATKNARKKCFHLCLSSLPSISAHDLPSLLHSLLALVRNDEEGRLVMDGVRTEWMSVFENVSNENTGGTHISSSAYESSNAGLNGDDLGLLIGEVLIEHIQTPSLHTGKVPSSSYLAKGFIDTLKNSLRIQHAPPKNSNSSKQMEGCYPLTPLDVIVLVALYSIPDHQCSIESILDSMVHYQTLAEFIKLMHPLIRTWLPSDMSRRSERQRMNSLLYEPLASPMISILFYILITSSSLVPQNGSMESALKGGLLPFHAESISHVKNMEVTNTRGPFAIAECCIVFSHLFSAVDPQRQELIINSLLSMVSDSFVRSTILDWPKKRNKKWQEASNAAVHELTLIATARAACRSLLLITNTHASVLSQMRGAVLDRLLSLASMSVQATSSTESCKYGDGAMAYQLFDMNCAIIISLLTDSDQRERAANHSTTAADGDGSSELLILCQKLLFSANDMSTKTATASSNYQHRAICGLILASRLLRCKLIPNGERGGILSWVMSVISPSSSSVTPLEALNPEIARWGLTFLQFASSVMLPIISKVSMEGNCTSYFPEMAHIMDTHPVCGQSDVFAQVKKMLATAAIVQMEDSLRLPLLHATPQNEDSIETSSRTFLAFAKVSPHGHLHKKKSQATIMVISAPYFLYGNLAQKESLQTSMAIQSKPFLKSINLVADYVYDLVDRYLQLGLTTTTSWNPRGWLLAKTQLPCCLSQSAMETLGMKKNYGLEVDWDLREDTSDSSASLIFDPDNDDSFQKRWKLLFSNETRSNATLVQNLVEFVNCLIISISVSSATLKHAYRHFEREEAQLATIGSDASNLLSDEASRLYRRKRKQLEGLRKLLQFQVNKIHTMQRICKNIFFALSRLYGEVCNFGTAMAGKCRTKGVAFNGYTKKYSAIDATLPNQKWASQEQSENKASHNRKQIPLSEVKATVIAVEVFLSSQINTIDNSLLWSCLDDERDDTILLEHYAGVITGPPDSRVFQVLLLRRKILRYLHRNMMQLSSDNNGSVLSHPGAKNKLHHSGALSLRSDNTGSVLSHPETKKKKLHHSGALSLCGISRLFRMAISLTSCMNNSVKRGEGLARQKSNFDADLGRSIMGTFISAHYKLLLAVLFFGIDVNCVAMRPSVRDNIHIALAISCHLPPKPKDTDTVYSWFASIIQRCAESISSTPMEPANSSGLEESLCSLSSLSVSADALSENLLRQLKHCQDASISCHIIDLLSILYMHTECSSRNGVSFADALQSVYTSSVCKANLPYTLFKMNDILIRATQIEEHGSDRTSIVKENFKALVCSSNVLLKAKDSFTVAFVHHLLSYWSSLVLERTSQFHSLTELVEALDTFLSISFGRSSPPRKKNNLPGLNEKTYSSLFELLLHLINASLSLSRPHCSTEFSNSYQKEGPYEEVLWPLESYGKLLSIFQSYHIFFPRRFLFTVIKSSLLMVRLSDCQLRECVQWRNSQHSQIGTGRDSASAEFLQPLVDGVAVSIARIFSFCKLIKSQLNSDKRSLGSSYKQTKAIAGLLYCCEGTQETLHSICQSQNLISPSVSKSLESSRDCSKRKRDDHNDVDIEKKRQGNNSFPPQRKIRSSDSSDKMLTSPSVLELLPESGHSKGIHYDSININCKQQPRSEESSLNGDEDDGDDSVLGLDDDDSFGVIGDWAG